MERAIIALSQIRNDIGPDHPHAFNIDKMICFAKDSLAISPSTSVARVATSEQQIELVRFSDAAKEVLLNDGAVFYLPTGATILEQRERQASKGKPSFWYLVGGEDRLLALPSRRVEVAIFPDPERFFVPGSFGKNIYEQESLVAADAQALRQKLGLSDITQIVPEEASSIAEVVFQHLDETGVWLFGREYAAAQGFDYVYGRTKNPTNKSGSSTADVGGADPDRGLRVDNWFRDDGVYHAGVVRWVVPSSRFL